MQVPGEEAAPSAPTQQVAADDASQGRGWLRGLITPNGQRQVEPESTYAACKCYINYWRQRKSY